MLELSPPYQEHQLKSFAQKIMSCKPPEGYPPLNNRLSAYHLSQRALLHQTGVLHIPPGHDAINSSHRRSAYENRGISLDPDILTGSNCILAATKIAQFISMGYVVDQHGRPLHPGFSQLLALSDRDGCPIGMPTGIGHFYHYGRNGMSYGIIFRKNYKKEDEVLLAHFPEGGWMLPGGYEQSSDSIAPNLDPSILCATRKIFEATGLEVDGVARVVACRLPIGPADTLNAWKEVRAVAFTNESEEYLRDVSAQPRGHADDAGWFLTAQILRGEVEIPASQERYIAEACEIHLQAQNM